MKLLKNTLKGLGFKALTQAVLVCRYGSLVHTVMLTKDRHGSGRISVMVSIPAFLEADGPLTRDSLQTPLMGDVSPRGVVPSWVSDEGRVDAVFVTRVITGFFSAFACPDDVRRALDGLWVSPHFAPLLALDAPIPASVESLPLAGYQVIGGALSPARLEELTRAHLMAALAPLGFLAVPGADVLAVRQRGDMFDGVRLIPDEFGTFLTLICFPWPAAVWEADPKWEDRFYPMLPFDVRCDGEALVLSPQEFLQLEARELGELLKEGLAQAGAVSDHREFADRLDTQFATLASRLRQLCA